MLLLHQIGTVKIGEVVRYTVTYTPSQDRILPSPEKLHLRIRNTSAIALRAAFVHGPYNLCVAAYPAAYNPNAKFSSARRHGIPEFEPMVKAGGSWQCELLVPEHIRQSAGIGLGPRGASFGSSITTTTKNTTIPASSTSGGHSDETAVSWIIEVSSQVIFSASATVNYEIVLARDEKSLHLSSSLPVIGGQAQVPQPGKVSDHQQHQLHHQHHTQAVSPRRQNPNNNHPGSRGIFSRAIRVKVEDTAALWNTPRLPGWDCSGGDTCVECGKGKKTDGPSPGLEGTPKHKKKQKKVHLVVLTHGLHSNLGADMLYLKESIDATVRQAKIDAKARRARERAKAKAAATSTATATAPVAADASADEQEGEEEEHDSEEDDEHEDVIVRGFSGNATRTERGIKFLGKRLARYVLSTCYPDQPYLPPFKGANDVAAAAAASAAAAAAATSSGASRPSAVKSKPDSNKGNAVHRHGTTSHSREGAFDDVPSRPYNITSISFIGHSLGGLVQTYAVAYIQKHSPTFFDLIKPINFIALATPFLGLSNENPLYVKFALDFGLVGRTGQDLGLTWRAPTIARSGWGALVSNLSETAQKKVMGESRPESKPLLRILPTGPAHTALKKFRQRTVYSNVVNDGIVPLRTSCLLFLDWQGLGRVEKARRDAGLVETLVGAGWAELTGANVTAARREAQKLQQLPPDDDEEEKEGEEGEDEKKSDTSGGVATPTPTAPENASEVPQPPQNAIVEDDKASIRSIPSAFTQSSAAAAAAAAAASSPSPPPPSTSETNNSGPLAGFLSFFRGSGNGNGNSSGNRNGNGNRSGSTTPPTPTPSTKQHKILRRSQTIKLDDDSSASHSGGSKVTSGQEYDHDTENLNAPPRTTVFESAHDLINPTLPSTEFVLNPSKRPRTIFHDRVYHPSDIPPPPMKPKPTSTGSFVIRRRTTGLSSSSNTDAKDHAPGGLSSSPSSSPRLAQKTQGEESMPPPPTAKESTKEHHQAAAHEDPNNNNNNNPNQEVDGSQMRVEEKIARAYHRDMSWRKVLVKLEPDAHNNIIVRRMFANAFGWPVVKHLVDAHFSDAANARTRVDDMESKERALDIGQPPTLDGSELKRDKGNNGDVAAGPGAGAVSRAETVPQQTARHEAEKAGTDGKNDVSAERQSKSGNLAREAEDRVSELPNMPRNDAYSQSSGARGDDNTAASSSSSPQPFVPPPVTRVDSMTWSEGDWVDSDESGTEAEDQGGITTRRRTPLAPSQHGTHDMSRTATTTRTKGAATPTAKGTAALSTPQGQGDSQTASSLSSPLLSVGSSGWNWAAEKIVGRSATSRSSSPVPPTSSHPQPPSTTATATAEQEQEQGHGRGAPPSKALGLGIRSATKSPPAPPKLDVAPTSASTGGNAGDGGEKKESSRQ